MKVTATRGHIFDMVRLSIETGATYDSPQEVKAELALAETGNRETCLVFNIVDDSRGMYEKVRVMADWGLIRACQNDTWTQAGVERMAGRIMEEYLHSRYCYLP